jgi:hypothetical protein
MSDLVIEVAMLGPRGNELGPRQIVPVTTETATLWQAISTLGELDRITVVGADVNGLAARIARESQRPLRTITRGALQWSSRIRGQGVELALELAPRLRSTLFHDGVEVPGLDLGALRATKHKRYVDYLAPRVIERRGEETWARRLSRAVDELIGVWNPAALYLAAPPTLPLPSTLPACVHVVPVRDRYESALLAWPEDAGSAHVMRDS